MKTGRIVYITIPREQQHLFTGYPLFDPAIPLPVELLPEHSSSGTRLDSNTITAEMILSGILLELAADPAGEHAHYYRRLITALRPDIADELKTAAHVKSRNGDYNSAEELLALMEGLQGDSLLSPDVL